MRGEWALRLLASQRLPEPWKASVRGTARAPAAPPHTHRNLQSFLEITEPRTAKTMLFCTVNCFCFAAEIHRDLHYRTLSLILE